MHRTDKLRIIKDAIKQYAIQSARYNWPPEWYNSNNLRRVDKIAAEAIKQLEEKK